MWVIFVIKTPVKTKFRTTQSFTQDSCTMKWACEQNICSYSCSCSLTVHCIQMSRSVQIAEDHPMSCHHHHHHQHNDKNIDFGFRPVRLWFLLLSKLKQNLVEITNNSRSQDATSLIAHRYTTYMVDNANNLCVLI